MSPEGHGFCFCREHGAVGSVSVQVVGEGEIDLRPDVDETDLDRAVAASALALSAIPVIGSLIAQTVQHAIPNQRIDRIADMLKILDRKVSGLQKDVLELRMQTEEFRDLLEDGLWQTTRALTHERREYIASLLKNSLTSEQLTHEWAKTLMSVLEELNDSELIILGWYGTEMVGPQADEYYRRHEDVLSSPIFETGMFDEELTGNVLRTRYHEKLESLGLVRTVQSGRLDQIGRHKRITPLGRMLLRQIDFYSLQELDEPS